MTFHILQNSTTADATDENDNFLHIGQGSRLPMGGQSLTATDGVYDLGSSATAWNNLYCNNVYTNTITGDSGLWTKIYDNTINTGTRLEVSGLDGDSDELYRIFFFFHIDPAYPTGGGLNPSLFINGDSAVSYGRQSIDGTGANPLANRDTNLFGIPLGQVSLVNLNCFAEVLLYSKTGYERLAILKRINQCVSTTVTNIEESGIIWDNTSDTITSLVFLPEYSSSSRSFSDTSAHIIIFKKG